jgi:uncharacterized membrane protein YdjX (TVP38/TMEM64 family)
MRPRPATDTGVARLDRYVLVVAGLPVVFLLTFVLVGDVPITQADAQPGVPAAVLGVALLTADVVLPVPASLVMVANGLLFGIAAGAALSVAGSVAAALVGYLLGRWAGRPVLFALCSAATVRRADRLLQRWGAVAVAASRPVPLLAETVAIAAGAAAIGIPRTLVSAAVGAVPGAVVFAAAGAAAWQAPHTVVVFAAVIALSAVLAAVGRRVRRGPA